MMDLDFVRLAADDVQVSGLKKIIDQAMGFIKEVKCSKQNSARLQSHAQIIIKHIICIAEHMRGRWSDLPPNVTKNLDDFERILRKISNGHVQGRASQEAFLASCERQLDEVEEAICSALKGNAPLAPPQNNASNPHHIDRQSRATRAGVRILSLCGDGVRALSQLLILREVMAQVARLKNNSGYHRQLPPLPCEYFDLIVGTGSGAISAIFLGRLGMTVQEAMEHCSMIIRDASRAASSVSPFDMKKPAKYITDRLWERLSNPFASMSDPTGCPTLVFAARRSNVDAPPEPFRTYHSLTAFASQFTVMEVASAVCAPPSSPVLLGPPGCPAVAYMNAAPFKYNNPTHLAIYEAKEIWRDRDINLVLCIGTGTRAVVKVSGGHKEVASASTRLAAGSELVHETANRLSGEVPPFVYHRLQIDRELETIPTDHWRMSDEDTETLVGVTEGYLRSETTRRLVSSCAAEIHGNPLPQHVAHTAPHVDPRYQPRGNPKPQGVDKDPKKGKRDEDVEDTWTGVDTSAREEVLLNYKSNRGREVRIFSETNTKGQKIVMVKQHREPERLSRSSRNTFSKDLEVYQPNWDTTILQFIGASKATDTLLFLPTQLQSDRRISFFHWLDNWARLPIDVFHRLHDMGDSFKALQRFYLDCGMSPRYSRNDLVDYVVEIEPEGDRLQGRLISNVDNFPLGGNMTKLRPLALSNNESLRATVQPVSSVFGSRRPWKDDSHILENLYEAPNLFIIKPEPRSKPTHFPDNDASTQFVWCMFLFIVALVTVSIFFLFYYLGWFERAK